MKKYILADGKNLNKEERIRLAYTTKNPKILYRLAFDKCEEVIDTVERNANTPIAALEYLLDKYKQDHLHIDQHLNNVLRSQNSLDLFNYVLDNFEIDDDDAAAIINKVSSENVDILTKLVNNPNPSVRRCVARNLDKLPDDLVDILAYDTNSSVRHDVAIQTKNPEILEILAFDPDYSVRERVAYNDCTSYDTVKELLDDKNSSVVSYLISAHSDKLNPDDWNTLIDAGLEHLRGGEVRFNRVLASAAYQDLPEAAMLKLAENADLDDTSSWSGGFSTAVAHNCNATPRILECLLDHQPNARCLREIINNPNITDELLNRVPEVLSSARGEYSDDKKTAQIALLKRINDVDYLRSFSDRLKPWEFREAVASNKNTPMDLLEVLARDGSKQVREAAVFNLTVKRKEAEAQAAAAQQPVEAPKPKKPASKSEWSISPYELENYADISEELTGVIAQVMNKASKELKSNITYQFDNDNYDDAFFINVSTDSGASATLDAQRFLSILTSVFTKPSGITKAADYVVSILSRSLTV